MPRLGKKKREEWSYFMKNGRRQYNKICKDCVHDCRQSHRVIIVSCRRYESRRKNMPF